MRPGDLVKLYDAKKPHTEEILVGGGSQASNFRVKVGSPALVVTAEKRYDQDLIVDVFVDGRIGWVYAYECEVLDGAG